MADHAAGDDIFVYTGGRAPQHVVNAIIDESIDKIDDYAFCDNRNLRSVVCHDGLLKVGEWTFDNCRSLQRIKMPGVKVIGDGAFYECRSLTHVELNKLETVGEAAFDGCTSLKRVKLPKVKTIGQNAFLGLNVEDAELGEDLETIGSGAFLGSKSKLRRIAIPLKDGLFQWDDDEESYTQFFGCHNLTTVDLVGGIHKTVASLHLQSWRDEMTQEIQRINQILPGTQSREKTDVMRQWIQSVIGKIDHYKAEHRALLKDATTRLELALWDAKLENDKENKHSLEEPTAAKKAKIDVEEARREARITSGADIVIKNVLPFLMLVD